MLRSPQIALFLTLSYSIAGCSSGERFALNLDWDQIDIEVTDANLNTAALEFGFKFDKGVFENDIFRATLDATPPGWCMRLENKSEFLMVFNWTKSVLVDREGTCHSILNPMSDTKDISSQPVPVITIAPFSHRILLLVPVSFQIITPVTTDYRSVHPSKGEFQRMKSFNERVVFVIDFKGKELVYDVEVTCTRTGSRPTTQPQSQVNSR